MVSLRFCTFFLLVLASGATSILDKILAAFEGAVDCGSCHALLVPLQALAFLGDSAFVDTFVALCRTLKVSTTANYCLSLTNVQCMKLEDDDVCQGAIGEQGPIIAHDLRNILVSGQTGTMICDALFGLCQAPAVNPYVVPIPSAAPANPKVWKSSHRKPFQVLHFSDVHIDRQYTVNSHHFIKI